MKKLKRIIFLLSILFVFKAFALTPSFKIHKTKIDETIKNCPKNMMSLAKELLQMELAGMRWRATKPSCFESLKMKYIHAIKMPDAQALDLVKVKKGSEKILKIKENKEFYTQDVFFQIKNDEGKIIKSSFSFMPNTKPGGKKDGQGCALLSSTPNSAFVSEDCL